MWRVIRSGNRTKKSWNFNFAVRHSIDLKTLCIFLRSLPLFPLFAERARTAVCQTGGEESESPDSRIVSRGSRCFLFREQIKIRGNRNIGEIRQNEPKIHAFGVRRVGSDRRRAKKWGTGALKRRETVTSIQRALCGLRPQRAPYAFGF